MRQIALPVVALMLITPTAHSAGTYEPAPAATPAPISAPEVTTSPKSNSSPAPTRAAAVTTVQSEIARVSGIIGAGDYSGARAELLKVNKSFPNDANVNNLLGYTSRKLGQLKPSEAYYKRALAINPKHLGALEYQGELFLTLKRLPAARNNLKKLAQICGVNCTEYKALKVAIDKKR